jgi:hypothetical protein
MKGKKDMKMDCESCGGSLVVGEDGPCVCAVLSRAFDAGNYCNAYETNNLAEAEEKHKTESEGEAYMAAFLLGFFSSYELEEIPYDVRDIHEEAYNSKYGKVVLKRGWIDPREK